LLIGLICTLLLLLLLLLVATITISTGAAIAMTTGTALAAVAATDIENRLIDDINIRLVDDIDRRLRLGFDGLWLTGIRVFGVAGRRLAFKTVCVRIVAQGHRQGQYGCAWEC
jgi:hypothetical protein